MDPTTPTSSAIAQQNDVDLHKLILGSRIDLLTFVANPVQDFGPYKDALVLLREVISLLPLSPDSHPLSRDAMFRKILSVVSPHAYHTHMNAPIGNLLPSRLEKTVVPYPKYAKSVVEGSIPPDHPNPRHEFNYVRVEVEYPDGKKYSVHSGVASLKQKEIASKRAKATKSGRPIADIKPLRRQVEVMKEVVVDYQDGTGRSVRLSAPEAAAFREKIAEWKDVCDKIQKKLEKMAKRKRVFEAKVMKRKHVFDEDEDGGEQGHPSTSAESRPIKKRRGLSPPTIRIPTPELFAPAVPASTVASTSTAPGVIRIPPRPSFPSESTSAYTPSRAGATTELSLRSPSRHSASLGSEER